MLFIKKNSKFFLFILFLIISTLFVSLIAERKAKFNLSIEYVENLNYQENYLISFCGFTEENEYHLWQIEITTFDNIYQTIFDFYNIKRNYLPVNCIIPSSSLIFAKQMIITNETLTIVLQNESIPFNEYDRIFKAMKVTYMCLGIKTLIIEHNGKIMIY